MSVTSTLTLKTWIIKLISLYIEISCYSLKLLSSHINDEINLKLIVFKILLYMFYNWYLHNAVTKFNAVPNKNRKETCIFFKISDIFYAFGIQIRNEIFVDYT